MLFLSGCVFPDQNFFLLPLPTSPLPLCSGCRSKGISLGWSTGT
uniref:Uncharacterized protein n=1 Tax=Anguilla anguilla TaxID=7936 RepID=A0A0E9PAL6_ANGAN